MLSMSRVTMQADRGIVVKQNFVAMFRNAGLLARTEPIVLERLHLSAAHPYVVQLLKHTETADVVEMVLALEDRGDLLEYLLQNTCCASLTRNTVDAVGTTLTCLHAMDVTHGDMTLENLLVTAAGTVKVADFGLAQVGRRGPFAKRGKRSYCPQVRGHRPGPVPATARSTSGQPHCRELPVWSIPTHRQRM